ncbi:hypothetical protein ZWY2020_019659 [Hordeum vulgare]|nr:hypothetical protein ZWY2020_019659 [Hordeum vulgare]
MGASAATGMQMVAARLASQLASLMLGSKSVVSAFEGHSAPELALQVVLRLRQQDRHFCKPQEVCRQGDVSGAVQGLPLISEAEHNLAMRQLHAFPSEYFFTTGKRAFIAGVADDNGYGWATAKALAAAGAEILLALNIFETSLRRGKFDESMEITKVHPLDAVFDSWRMSKQIRGTGSSKWTVKEVAETVKDDFGSIDILVHSLANGPEVTKPLLETSRSGYLAAVSASSYSFISLLQHFLPIMNPGGASISLTYIASERTIPGYGGGMSSAKAALESDTRVLAFEAGRKGKIRKMIEYFYVNAPLQKELLAEEVGNAAAFLVSPLASAITGSTVYVDNGLNTMALMLTALLCLHKHFLDF